MATPRSVGILGGSGPAGRGLGLRLAAAGWDVHLGSRVRERAEQAAAKALDGTKETLRLVGATNEEAASQPVVVLATPWDGAVPTVSELRDELAGKVVVSMVNAIARVGREFQALVPVRGSMAATVQAALPDSLVTAAFHHLPAGTLATLDEPLDADVLVCADDSEAGAATLAMVDSISGLRGVLAGTLASANAVEALTAVLLNVNIRYKAHVALLLAGLVGER